jgi:hypothetical protein
VAPSERSTHLAAADHPCGVRAGHAQVGWILAGNVAQASRRAFAGA